MSSEYGFSGEIALNTWDSGFKMATRDIEKGDFQSALRGALIVEESYQKHRRGTETWQKITNIVTLIIIAIAIILGLVTREWVVAVVIGVIGLLIFGFLENRIVSKRIAVDNAFYDKYEYLMNAIEDLEAD